MCYKKFFSSDVNKTVQFLEYASHSPVPFCLVNRSLQYLCKQQLSVSDNLQQALQRLQDRSDSEKKSSHVFSRVFSKGLDFCFFDSSFLQKKLLPHQLQVQEGWRRAEILSQCLLRNEQQNQALQQAFQKLDTIVPCEGTEENLKEASREFSAFESCVLRNCEEIEEILKDASCEFSTFESYVLENIEGLKNPQAVLRQYLICYRMARIVYGIGCYDPSWVRSLSINTQEQPQNWLCKELLFSKGVFFCVKMLFDNVACGPELLPYILARKDAPDIMRIMVSCKNLKDEDIQPLISSLLEYGSMQSLFAVKEKWDIAPMIVKMKASCTALTEKDMALLVPSLLEYGSMQTLLAVEEKWGIASVIVKYGGEGRDAHLKLYLDRVLQRAREYREGGFFSKYTIQHLYNLVQNPSLDRWVRDSCFRVFKELNEREMWPLIFTQALSETALNPLQEAYKKWQDETYA